MSEILTQSAMPERYRFDQQNVCVPVGNNQELFHCDLTGATSLVPRHEARLLQSCHRFATLDEHAGRVCSESGLGPLHFGAVRQQLSKFADAGLLVPHSLLLERCRNGTAVDTASRIAYFGVLTRNRPQYLNQCLESYAHAASRSKREIVFIVADQSDRQYHAANAEALAAIKAHHGIEIWHIDLAQANKIAGQLSGSSGVPVSLVDFALLRSEVAPFSGGANRNLLLLASAGELILQADDDSACRVMPAPDMCEGLVLSSAADPAEFWFPTEAELSALEERFVSEDLFALHERFLGKSVSQCMHECDGAVDIDAANASFYRRLSREQAKILATNSGLVGESVRGEGQPIIVLDGDKRTRLVVSEQHYRYVQKTQRLLRGVSRPTITEGAVCFGFNLGLDNREIVPPFMPIMRGEDSMFTPLFRAATSNGFFAILPWLVYHAGAGAKRRPNRLEAKMVSRLSFADIISLILQSYQARTFEVETGKRLQAISALFLEIGSLPEVELERVLRTMWWQTASMQIFKLETALKRHSNQPAFWSKDIAEYIEEYRNSFVDPRSIVACDLVAVFGEAQAFAKQKELLRQFGELIGAWAHLRQAAADLRQSEGSFGKRV